MDENYTKFCKVAEKYDPADINALLVIYRNQASIRDNELYEGMRNLFANIMSLSSIHIGSKRIDFNNCGHCRKLFEAIEPYLAYKYIFDRSELSTYKENGQISYHQLNYEISSPKTYARTFVETLPFKLQPFESFLIKHYGIDLKQLAKSCHSLLKDIAKPCDLNQLLTHELTNITAYFPPTFLDDLISINKRELRVDEVNSFSKEIRMPIVKTNNEYNVLSFEVFIDCFYTAVHRLCLSKTYLLEKDHLLNQKGQLFNDSCKIIFKNEMGFKNVYENFKHSTNGENGEIDLLVEEKDVLFVIECKARNYTTQISGISTAFEKANKSNLDLASTQIQKFLELLNDRGKITLSKGNERLTIAKEKYNYIIPLVINVTNLAELNTDYISRNLATLFLSFDDLKILSDVIEKRKWLFVDFCSQFLEVVAKNPLLDDVVDIFAFYCHFKNLSLLIQKRPLIINQLGNDYFQFYFSYQTDKNPIFEFRNDISVFDGNNYSTYKECLCGYHSKN